jgi:hypothetical protein
MEQLLADLRAVYAKGAALISEYQQKLKFVVEEKLRLDKIREDLDAQKHSMEAREAECSKVENVQKLHKDATALLDAANSRVNAAVEAEKALKIHQSTVNQELDNKRELVRREGLAVDKQRSAIEAEVAAQVQAVLKSAGYK